MTALVTPEEPWTKRRPRRPALPAFTCSRAKSDQARSEMESLQLEPFWLCQWRDVVLLHLETDPELLQQVVPFDLDLFNGRAIVSLVAFTLKDMHPRFGGKLTHTLFKPFGTHRFLNVRAYVHQGNARGIYFLAEYLDAPWLNHFAGPLLYGLPFHIAELSYQQNVTDANISGSIVNEGGAVQYAGTKSDTGPNSIDEFLLERYRAFTHRNGGNGWFPVWHKPWQYQSVDAEISQHSLLDSTGGWADDVTLVSAHYSKGFDEVWMGLRRALRRTTEH